MLSTKQNLDDTSFGEPRGTVIKTIMNRKNVTRNNALGEAVCKTRSNSHPTIHFLQVLITVKYHCF